MTGYVEEGPSARRIGKCFHMETVVYHPPAPGDAWKPQSAGKMAEEDVFMGTNAIIAAIDKELARLQEVRSLLIEKGKAAQGGQRSGAASASKAGTKSRLSPAARARIAEAQRRRWAAVRKAKG